VAEVNKKIRKFLKKTPENLIFTLNNEEKDERNIYQFQSRLAIRIHFSITLLAVAFTGKRIQGELKKLGLIFMS